MVRPHPWEPSRAFRTVRLRERESLATSFGAPASRLLSSRYPTSTPAIRTPYRRLLSLPLRLYKKRGCKQLAPAGRRKRSVDRDEFCEIRLFGIEIRRGSAEDGAHPFYEREMWLVNASLILVDTNAAGPFLVSHSNAKHSLGEAGSQPSLLQAPGDGATSFEGTCQAGSPC